MRDMPGVDCAIPDPPPPSLNPPQTPQDQEDRTPAPDKLAAARGVFVGLALVLPGWLLLAWLLRRLL